MCWELQIVVENVHFVLTLISKYAAISICWMLIQITELAVVKRNMHFAFTLNFKVLYSLLGYLIQILDCNFSLL